MMKLSSGTASVLGLSKIKTKAPPTTGYIMLGSNCTNNCQFCTQSQSSKSNDTMLSRIDWHHFEDDCVIKLAQKAFTENTLKRLCFQVVDSTNSVSKTLETLKKFDKTGNIPICASSTVKNVDDARALFDAGLDRLCVAMDAASEHIYNKVKGNDFHDKLDLLLDLSKEFPGKITTHLIVGLGETEYEMAKTISLFADNNIQVALFAFTPVKGTQMESHPAPSIESYRKIQIIHYLLENKFLRFDEIVFDEENISSITNNELLQVILSANGKPFMTSGCPDCNRPYYNESPGSIPYNYPYQPNENEIIQAIAHSSLFETHF